MLRTSLAAVLLTTCAVAMAENAPGEAFKPDAYIGLGTLRTGIKADISGFSFDGRDTGWQAVIGGRFTPNVGLEAGYLSGGTVRDVVGGVPVSVDTTALQGSLIGSAPISDIFSLHGRIGLIKWDGKGRVGGLSTEDDGTELIYGAGASLRVQKFLFRVDWQQFNAEDFDANLLALSVLLSI